MLLYCSTYLADHSGFIPDWWQKLWIFCSCSGVNDGLATGNGTDGPSSGTGLEDGVGAWDLKAFCKYNHYYIVLNVCPHVGNK